MPGRCFVILLSGVLAALHLGCPPSSKGGDDTLICSQEIRAGINVEVRDALTGAPAACGATAFLRVGDLVETVTAESRCAMFPDTLILSGAYERAGTYAVVVKKGGYKDWTQEEVVVTADACHVHPVTLQANLEPEP